MSKQSMATTLITCLLTLALLSSASLLGNIWLGISYIAAEVSNSNEIGLMVGAIGVGEAAVYSAAAALGGATLGGTIVVGVVVGL